MQYVREQEVMDVSDLLTQISRPTLVTRIDPFFVPARSSQRVAAKIPGAKKVVIPAAGHAVNIDQPQAFIDAVIPFLDALDTARTGRVAS